MFRLYAAAIGIAFSLFACGGSAISDNASPTMSGQVFIESHSGGTTQFITPAGVTVEHWMDGIFIETTFTDMYGRFQFQSTMMSNCRIRIVDSFYSIDSTYDLDMFGRDEASVYLMVYDSGGQNYAWAHEFTSRWSEMQTNFDGTLDTYDMQNFWQEGSHSWLAIYAGRIMYMM